jgi:hypothetical protein
LRLALGHEAKKPRFKQLGRDGRPAYFIQEEVLHRFETLIDELIRRPLLTGRAEDGWLPESGRAPGCDQPFPWLDFDVAEL